MSATRPPVFTALSRPKHGLDSRRGHQPHQQIKTKLQGGFRTWTTAGEQAVRRKKANFCPRRRTVCTQRRHVSINDIPAMRSSEKAEYCEALYRHDWRWDERQLPGPSGPLKRLIASIGQSPPAPRAIDTARRDADGAMRKSGPTIASWPPARCFASNVIGAPSGRRPPLPASVQRRIVMARPS